MSSSQNCFQSSGWSLQRLNFVQIYIYIIFFGLFVSIYETTELTIVHNFKYKSNTKHSPLALCYFLFPNSLSPCCNRSFVSALSKATVRPSVHMHIRSHLHGTANITAHCKSQSCSAGSVTDRSRIILAKELSFVCVIVISKLQCLSCSRHSGSAT